MNAEEIRDEAARLWPGLEWSDSNRALTGKHEIVVVGLAELNKAWSFTLELCGVQSLLLIRIEFGHQSLPDAITAAKDALRAYVEPLRTVLGE